MKSVMGESIRDFVVRACITQAECNIVGSVYIDADKANYMITHGKLKKLGYHRDGKFVESKPGRLKFVPN